MAMKDAKIKYLEHELEEKERALELMREVDQVQPPAPVAGDARIGTLERRVRELEAVVKGLTEEVLDLKALTLKLAKTAERHEGPATARTGPGPDRGAAVVRAHGPRPPAERGEARPAPGLHVPAPGGCRAGAGAPRGGDGPDHAARRDNQARAAPQERVHHRLERAPEPAPGRPDGRGPQRAARGRGDLRRRAGAAPPAEETLGARVLVHQRVWRSTTSSHSPGRPGSRFPRGSRSSPARTARASRTSSTPSSSCSGSPRPTRSAPRS